MAKTKAVGKSKNYEKVKSYYDRGLWPIDRIYNAVGKWITEIEYQEITGTHTRTKNENRAAEPNNETR